MGLVLGRIPAEIPKYEVIKSATVYEIRKYQPCVIAEVTFDPSQINRDSKSGAFSILANYIGAFGNPHNARPEKIAMTVPVITKSDSAEKIAMTVPVVTKEAAADAARGEKKMETMQFILPSKYTRAEEAPKPLDERVVIKDGGEKKYGMVKFSGVATEQVVADKGRKLIKSLEGDGYKVVGVHLLARYNPPWMTLPMLRTNEVKIPVE